MRRLRCAVLAGAVFAGVAAWAADPAGGITERPLAPHPYPRGKTMFVQLPPEQTGVVTTNNYADPKMRGELYQEFETSSIGSGVAIGDYDGDGRPDIFVVSKTESCRLFRNLGNFKFEDVTDKAGVGDHGPAAMVWKQGATFVDVNNDGLLDIYVCRTRAPNLLYINQGDGTFKEMAHAYGLDVNDSSVMASFCDYDRDGWLDVYIATNILDIVKRPNGQRGYLFHNNRDGTFTDVTERAGITGETQSHSATWWDYDNDGWPDLYVAYDYGLPDSLYHNNRDGTFTNVIDRVVPHTSFSSMGADVGDVNNDGLIDFLVADMAATSHRWDHHMMADARGRTEELPNDSTAAPKYHRSALLLNTGTGHCLEAGFLAGIAATDWTWSPRFEDLDNDGRVDFFVTNGFPRDPGEDVVRRLMKAETPAERIRIMYASPPQAEVHLAFRNLGDLRFENVSAAWGLDYKGVSFGTAFGDLAGDGNLDIVYTNYHGGASVYRNDNDTGHRVMIDLRGTISNRFGVGAVVRIESALGVQANQLWLARGYLSSSEPAVHFGLGEDTVIKRLVVTWPSGLMQTFENLPVDRRYTITEPAGPAPVLSARPAPPPPGQFEEVSRAAGLALRSREEVVNETAQQRLLPIRLNRRGPALAIGDIEGGGRDAVVVGGTTVDPLRILRVAGAGQFIAAGAPAPGTGSEIDDGPVLLFDAAGDGREDLLVTKGGNAFPAGAPEYQPRLFLNDGHGGFRPAADGALPALSISAGAVAAADFDCDGRLDLFIGARLLPGQYPLPPRSALLVNRGGTFEDVTDSLAPGLREVGMVTSALWTDVDGDGWPDLLLTLDWGNVKYFHNNQGKGFEDWTERAGFAAAGTGWWNSIAAADFNGDGRIDYVVGNLGLNTQYHADPAHPALLFSGDFKGDGSTQLIEGYYEGDKLYPWRTRRDMSAVFPSIAKRYPWADNYAPATLAQIFGEDKLNAARRFAATEFRSGVFLSQPDGTYRFEPLPRLAQIAPLQGMVAGDFDGDGHADLYAVQNSYAPIPYVGRFDGGLSQLLRGDGHGHFAPVPPAESGLVVPGDAKALAVMDLDEDGWPDFLVTQNHSVTLAFHNHGVAGRHPLRIELRGPPGNPTAVGARITVELADGSTETGEIYAGSGYYSQSTAACFFGYPDSNPARKIRIRWPSGSTSESQVPPGVTHLTMPMPGS
ncbi:MAG TPA: FG-GAP-like repeat-containing protein [Opitutaceae bacterium]|nr:FG-GAP-like repeat-containing protein [Opitutaceae bacterium]